MSENNVKVIQSIYEAFGKGDVPAILERVTDDTCWGFSGAQPLIVPWHKTAIGKEGVGGFIGSFVNNIEFSAFEPREFIASGDSVIAHIHLAYTVNSTKRSVDEEQLHWWKLNGEGKVTSLLHFEDTRQVVEACQP